MRTRKSFEARLMTLGHRIREIRKSKNLTLENMEERGYPSWRHFREIETGKNITLATLLRACDVLKISPLEVFK